MDFESKEIDLELRRNEKEKFRCLKLEENKNKDFIVSDDLLYTSDFRFEFFSDLGDSGELLIATNRNDSNDKYIIKHQYYDCACNEYMYSKIGNKMGISIALVKLFVVDDDNDMFVSDFICGVKYFDNAKHVNSSYVIQNKDRIINWEDYFRMLGLSVLLNDGDSFEVLECDNKIYRIDTSSSFLISDYLIHLLAYDYISNGIDIRDFSTKKILEVALGDSDYRFKNWVFSYNNFIEKYGREYLDYYLEPFYLLDNIKDSDIYEWIGVLTYIYPNVVGETYNIYFSNLKKDVRKYLVEFKDKK